MKPFFAWVILDAKGRKCGDPYLRKSEAVEAAGWMNKDFGPYKVQKIQCKAVTK